MDCDCEGPESEEEQEEGGAADWEEDLLNWEMMGEAAVRFGGVRLGVRR